MISLVFNHFSSESIVFCNLIHSFTCITDIFHISFMNTLCCTRTRAFRIRTVVDCLLWFASLFIVVCSMVTVRERNIHIYTRPLAVFAPVVVSLCSAPVISCVFCTLVEPDTVSRYCQEKLHTAVRSQCIQFVFTCWACQYHLMQSF